MDEWIAETNEWANSTVQISCTRNMRDEETGSLSAETCPRCHSTKE